MTGTDSEKSCTNGTFLYFAFASNMLRSRIHLKTPSAELIGPAKLQGYSLAFRASPGWCREDSLWRGAPATIDNNPEEHVWGALWRLKYSDSVNLDPPESKYRLLDVTVTSLEGQEFKCRTYQMVDAMEEHFPSPHYMKVIVGGAVQSGLPASYIDTLRSIVHNGDTQPPSIMDKLY